VRTAAAVEHGYIVRLVEPSTLGFTVPDVHIDVADLGHGSTTWAFNLSATNPLVTYTKKKVEGPTMPGSSTATTDTNIGVIFDPVVFAMIHLYN